MPLKISFTTLGCPDWDLDTIIDRAVEYGYDAVDFRMLRGEMEVYKLPEFSTRAQETKRRLDDAGLAISGFSSSARMFAASKVKRTEHLETVARFAELCGIFDVEYIRVFGGKLEGTPLDDAVAISLEALEKMADAGGAAQICVETHDDWVNTRSLAKVITEVQSANICVLWDLHHPFRQAGESPQETYDNIGRYTRYTHVKDSRPEGDGGFAPVLPGEGGDVPLTEMVNLLKGGGYEGYLTLEWEKHWKPQIADPEIAFPAYVPLLRQLAADQR